MFDKAMDSEGMLSRRWMFETLAFEAPGKTTLNIGLRCILTQRGTYHFRPSAFETIVDQRCEHSIVCGQCKDNPNLFE